MVNFFETLWFFFGLFSFMKKNCKKLELPDRIMNDLKLVNSSQAVHLTGFINQPGQVLLWNSVPTLKTSN